MPCGKYQPRPTTHRPSRYKVEGHTLTISILDDPRQNQSAAQYLQPTDQRWVTRKEVQPTTLAGVMRRFGTNKLPVPQPNTRAGRQFIAKNGNLKGKKVQSLIAQLTSPNPTGAEQYFVITDKTVASAPASGAVMGQERGEPRLRPGGPEAQVDTQIDFHGLLLESAKERLPALMEQKLRHLLR